MVRERKDKAALIDPMRQQTVSVEFLSGLTRKPVKVDISVNLTKHEKVTRKVILGYLRRDFNGFKPEKIIKYNQVGQPISGTLVGWTGIFQDRSTKK